MTLQNSGRNTARMVGILFIIARAQNVILLANNETTTRLGILLEFIMAVAVTSIPIVMYPILKRQNQSMALGYVVGRLVEGIMFTVGAFCMLALLYLSKGAVQTFAPDTMWTQLSLTLLSIRSAESIFAQFSFSIGSLMFYYILYKSELIPRWLAGWSIIGAVLFLASAFMVMFGLDSGSSLYIGLNAPGGLGEMVFAVYLIIKGFNPEKLPD